MASDAGTVREVRVGHDLYYNSGRGAREKGIQWQRPGPPREPAGRPESLWAAPRRPQEAPGALADGSRTPRSLQDGLGDAQEGRSRPERSPMTAQEGPKDGPRGPRGRPREAKVIRFPKVF